MKVSDVWYRFGRPKKPPEPDPAADPAVGQLISLGVSTKELNEAIEAFTQAISTGKKELPKEEPVVSAQIPSEFRDHAARGNLLWAKRLENTTSRDAEYTVSVVEIPSKFGASSYVVQRAFGPRGGGQNMSDIGTFNDALGAVSVGEKQIAAKLKRDYVEKLSWDKTSLSDPPSWDLSEDPLELAEDIRDSDVEEEEPPIAPARDCVCYSTIEELASVMWRDPEELTPDLAPLLLNDGFGLRELPLSHGARWLVSFNAQCAPGYDHVRAYPVGPEMTGTDLPRENRRNRAQWVEEIVRKNLASAYSRDEQNQFVLVVEEDVTDLVVIDVWLWNQSDAGNSPFSDRWGTMVGNFAATFPSTFGFKLATVHMSRLRDVYLGMGDQFRYELIDLAQPLPTPTWELPILEPLEE